MNRRSLLRTALGAALLGASRFFPMGEARIDYAEQIAEFVVRHTALFRSEGIGAGP